MINFIKKPIANSILWLGLCLALFCFLFSTAIYGVSELGYSIEAGTNISNMGPSLNENDSLLWSFKETNAESRISGSYQKEIFQAYWKSYFFKAEGFYSKYIFLSEYRFDGGVSGDLRRDINNSTSFSKSTNPSVKQLYLGLGYRWYKRGARPYLYLAGGWTRISYDGFNNGLSGSSRYWNLAINFSPSWQVLTSLDWGLDFGLSAGILADNEGTNILSQDPFQVLNPYETSGYLFELKAGMHFFYLPAGIYLQAKSRIRRFDTRVQGLGNNRIYYDQTDMALLEISIGFYYSKPKYNF